MVAYSDNLRLTLQDIGENDGTWGTVANTGVFELIEDAVASISNITVVAGVNTLTSNQGSADQARAAILNLTGALGASASIDTPAQSKMYLVTNNTTGAQQVTVQVTGGGGAGVILPTTIATPIWVYTDGTDFFEVQVANAINATTATTATTANQLLGVAGALYARLDVQQGFTKAQASTRVTLSEGGGNIAVDASTSNAFRFVFTGNFNLNNPTNGTDGQVIRFVFVQDGDPTPRTITWGAKYAFPGGTNPALSTASNAVDLAGFEYDQTLDLWVGNMVKALA